MLLTNFIRTSVAALGALAVASVTQANAADIYSPAGGYKDVPVAPCCSFSGFYIGGNAGMAWTDINLKNNTFYDDWGTPWNIGGKDLNSTNGFAGGQFGYNFQNACCWLYGIEVDLGALGVNNNSHRFVNTGGWNGNSYVQGVSLDGNNNNEAFFAGDVTGRIGYTWGNSLFYVKGGFAFVDVNNNNLRETIYWTGGGTTSFFGNGNNDNWLTGWTIGAGYEWKPCCQSNWSIKVEYLYYDFSNNNNNNNFNDGADLGTWRNNTFRNPDVTVNTFKIGFNYFLNPVAAAPLK